MKNFLFIALLASSFYSFVVLATTWAVDGSHSRLGFTIPHMGISEISGYFGKFETTCVSEKADFTDAVIELTAEISSINTGSSMRDGHLQGEGFFNAEKYPNLTFKSTSVKKGKGKNLTIVGDLTLRGVTKSVTINALHNGTITNPKSNTELAGFKVTGKIKRSDFGVAADMPATMLGDEISLIADLEMAKK